MLKQLLSIAIFTMIVVISVEIVHSEDPPVNQYDPNGNLISGDGKYYEYNDANQLVRVRSTDQSGPIIAEYFYDYKGQRVKKVENGVTTYYVGQHYETNVVAGVATNTSYFFADGERVAKKDSTGTYFFHPDHLGGVNAVTDSSTPAKIVAKTSYLPFGEVRQGGQEKYSYTGKEKDKATDLYYFDARFNSPELRHFTQADNAEPDLDDPQDLNRYAYVGNNPLNYVDPDGHKKKHHSKKKQKELAKQRAAKNAQKKANKKAEEKQRAAAHYAKHHFNNIQSYSLLRNGSASNTLIKSFVTAQNTPYQISSDDYSDPIYQNNNQTITTNHRDLDFSNLLSGGAKIVKGGAEFTIGALSWVGFAAGCSTLIGCPAVSILAVPGAYGVTTGSFDFLEGAGDIYSELTSHDSPFASPDWVEASGALSFGK